MKTIVYIDGYNLYYGALKHTEYKWLDLYKLFNERICPSVNSSASGTSDIQIKFFTANILGSVSPSPDSPKDQATYHRALLRLYPDQISIIKGSYSKEGSRRPASVRFKDHCDWTWKHLSNSDLAYAQLPKMIPTSKKPIRKPNTW